MTDGAAMDSPPAETLATVFGARAEDAQAYARLLASDGVIRGLIGPREVERIWTRHIFNCAAVVPLLPHGAAVCDVGSGAGLPGIVLALARPDVEVTLVEPLLRRTDFLDDVVGTLSLVNAHVLRARAEELHGRRTFDIVTARAVAPLDRLARWCLPLTRPGGELLALKGQRGAVELAEATDTLRRLGAEAWSAEACGDQPGVETTYVVRVRKRADVRTGHRRTT